MILRIFLLCFLQSSVLGIGGAQEIAETDIILDTKEKCLNLGITDCGDVFLTCQDSVTWKYYLAKYDPVDLSMEKVILPTELQGLNFTSFGKHPHTGDFYVGYYGGYVVTRDCGETWEKGNESAPTSNYSTIEFDSRGRMYVGSTSGEDVRAYWTEDYLEWHPFCYDAFSMADFDVSPNGTVVSIYPDTESAIYRVGPLDSCEILLRAYNLPEQNQARLNVMYIVQETEYGYSPALVNITL